MRESMIRALKENKKLIFIIGIVFISGILVGFSLSTIELPKSETETKLYVAIDDIGISGGTTPFENTVKITYDAETLNIGAYRGFIIRFDLSNKPKSWAKCEISLYEYFRYGYVSGRVYLFSGNWTEENWDGYGNYMRDFDIYWMIEDYIDTIPTYDLGFKLVDISDYINDITTPTFSIAVHSSVDGDWSVHFFSSEWNNTNHMLPFPLCEGDSYEDYLPQLIWS